jgi:2-polyprenyl-3-methyl-5-hydroxy-6-metoxy-1,4-benzoquinol methylase
MNKDLYVRSDAGYLPPTAQLGLFRLPRRREFLLEHVGATPKDVLDVGCAGGYIAVLLGQAGHRVVGLELNQRMADEARSLGVEVIECDVEGPLPLSDSCVDIVHACEVIEHLFDTEGFLRELHRLLRPRGILILSTPNLNSLVNRARVLVGRPLPMWGAFPDDRHGSHIRVFNKAKILELLRRTGFQPERLTGVNQYRRSWVIDYLPTFSELILVKATRQDNA